MTEDPKAKPQQEPATPKTRGPQEDYPAKDLPDDGTPTESFTDDKDKGGKR